MVFVNILFLDMVTVDMSSKFSVGHIARYQVFPQMISEWFGHQVRVYNRASCGPYWCIIVSFVSVCVVADN